MERRPISAKIFASLRRRQILLGLILLALLVGGIIYLLSKPGFIEPPAHTGPSLRSG